MVSVIVPVYNVKPYIEETIESIIKQSYRDIEIVLVDDGSTDGSGEICDAFAKQDNRVKVIHQLNRGLSAARNAGLDICTGEYIAFLDSDDAYCKEFVQVMLKSMRLSNADIVECNFAMFGDVSHLHEEEIIIRQLYFNANMNRAGVYTTAEALNMHCGGTIANNAWNKLFTRRIWNDLEFREGQNYEDVDIILPMLEKAQKVCLIDDVLVMHRIRKGSITQSSSFKNIRDCVVARQHYLEYIVAHTPMYFDKEVQTSFLERWLGTLLARYYHCAWAKMSEKDKCLKYLKNAIDDISSKVEIKKCKKPIRIAYFLCCNIPLRLATLIYFFPKIIMLPLRLVHR